MLSSNAKNDFEAQLKKLVVCVAVFGALSVTSAAAADLPRKAPASLATTTSNWTGFYVGTGIGGGWMRSTNYTFADPGGAAEQSCGPCGPAYDSPPLSGGNKTGVFAGVRVGYNWWYAPTWLAGVEADGSWASFKQSASGLLSNTPFVVPVPGSNLSFQTDVKWLASLRGRLGFVQNNWLIYGTGGVAFASINFSANAQCPPPVPGGCGVFAPQTGTTSPFSQTTVRVGFVLGGGVEWQLPGSHWRAQAEYLYYGFDQTTSESSVFLAVPGGGPLPCHLTPPTCSANYSFGKIDIHTLKLGVAYAF